MALLNSNFVFVKKKTENITLELFGKSKSIHTYAQTRSLASLSLDEPFTMEKLCNHVILLYVDSYEIICFNNYVRFS